MKERKKNNRKKKPKIEKFRKEKKSRESNIFDIEWDYLACVLKDFY